MYPLIRVLAFLPLIFAGKIRREERRVVESFRTRGALDADRAVSISAEGAIAGWIRQRLTAAGAIRSSGSRFYFDEAGYGHFRARRRRRAMIVLSVLLAAMAIAVLTGVVTL